MVPAQGSLDSNRLPPATALSPYGPMAPGNPPKPKHLRQDPRQTADQQAASSSQHHQDRQHRSSSNDTQGVGQSLSQQSGGVAGDNASLKHSLFWKLSMLFSNKALHGTLLEDKQCDVYCVQWQESQALTMLLGSSKQAGL